MVGVEDLVFEQIIVDAARRIGPLPGENSEIISVVGFGSALLAEVLEYGISHEPPVSRADLSLTVPPPHPQERPRLALADSLCVETRRCMNRTFK